MESGRDWTLDVDGDSFLIGRSREAEVSIRDRSVSKTHVRIDRLETGYRFQDLGSRNGTFINELRSLRGPLADGDELQVGNFLITFFRDASLAATRSTKEEAAKNGSSSAANGSSAKAALAEGEAAANSRAEEAGTKGEAAEDIVDQLVRELGGGSSPQATPTPVIESAPGRTAARPMHVEPARRGWSTPVLLAACAVCLLAGIAIGWAIAGPRGSIAESERLDRDREAAVDGRRRRSGQGSGDDAAKSAAASGVQEGEGGDESSETARDPLEFLSVGPLDRENPEVAHRSLRRLCLDILGRPPTRKEAADWLWLSSIDRLIAVEQTLAGEGDERAASQRFAQAEPEDLFERFVGRRPTARESSALAKRTEGRREKTLLALVGSPFYASEEHRRRRTPIQLARSLWVDVLDLVPEPADTDLVVAALEDPQTSFASLVDTLLESEEAQASGPGAVQNDGNRTGDLATWVEELFLRTTGRAPSEIEATRAENTTALDENGWRTVLRQRLRGIAYKTY